MPMKPRKPCSKPGCPALTDKRYCAEHERKERQRYDQERDKTEDRKIIHSARWRAISRAKLNLDPLCEECLKRGKDSAAVLVHHIDHDRHNENDDNLQSLCNACHEAEHKGERWKRR